MYVVQKPLDSCFRLLGLQKTDPEEILRPIIYLVRQPAEDGVLLFNVLTKELVLLSPEEDARFAADPRSVPDLVAHWFAVPEGHDDRLLARQYREVARMVAPPVKAITSYTIFTTTDCNARCFYCYELGRSRIPMSMETADRVAAFIIDQSKGNKVSLCWFGGEPLFNKSVITRICTRLREAGVTYRSSMVSNAYLMDEETVREAKNLWNLESIQITLDGTEAVYNKAKAFIYKGVNAYQTVLGNIRRLLKANIVVNIRINVDIHNADNLMALIEELHREYEGQKKLGIYTHELSDTDRLKFDKDENRHLIYEKRMQIQRKLEEWDMAKTKPLPRHIHYNHCMADQDSTVTILPDGHLGKCEHYSENNWFGHIDSPERDTETLARFKAIRDEYDFCATCEQYPDCIRLKMCNDINECYPEHRDEFIRKTQQQMLNTYEKFKKGETTDKSENEDDDEAQA